MSNTLLEFKNLVTEFHTEGKVVTAVNNISFTLNKGETIGIVGESGSGKSVTSLSAMRLIPSPPGKIANGEIIFHTKDVEKVDLLQLSEKEMRAHRGNDIAMIFQEPMTSLNPVFTCGDQVMEAIMLHQNISKSGAKDLTIKLFEEVQLPDPDRIFSTYPHQISGGQKHRIGIASALYKDPAILIFGEPTAALDRETENEIMSSIYNLSENQNKTIVIVSHNMSLLNHCKKIQG